FEDYVGVRGLNKYGKQKWRHYVADVVNRLIAALEPDDVVLGGGNTHKLKKLPPGCRPGENANAFLGGFRLWGNNELRKILKRHGKPKAASLIPNERVRKHTKPAGVDNER